MLDGMLLYNRPRRRDEVVDFVTAGRRRLYVFAAVRLALCSRLPISSLLSSAQTRATADAGAQLAHTGAQACSALGQAQRMQREDTGREQGGEDARGGGFTARRCARGLGGAYDIGRDGISSGSQLHTCGRDQVGGCAPGVSYRQDLRRLCRGL